MTYIEPTNFEPSKPKKSVAVESHSLFSKFILFFILPLLVITTWFLFSSKSVRIYTEPDYANIIIHTPLKLILAKRYLLRENDYNVKISAEGYQSIDKTFKVSEKQNQEFNFTLLPLPGNLQIKVDSAQQAMVLLDDIKQGIAPITINDLEAGRYTIRIETERYFPYRQDIEIEGKEKTQELNIELIPAWAKIEFTTVPEAAEILVDDKRLASTPATIELLGGKYNIKVRKPGFKEWQKTINVVASKDLTFTNIQLKPADATLHVESDPSGTNVTINGNYVGKTPLETAIIPEKLASVRLYKQGFIAKTRNVKVAAGQIKRINISMPFELVDVEFNLIPSDAHIYINNKLVQLSGKTLSLPTTKNNISIRKKGYVDYNSNITPIVGIRQNVKVTLKSLREQKLENIKPIITSKAGQKLKLFYPYAFIMGASRREPGRRSNESEQKIELKRAFYIGVNEVTNDEFRLYKSEHNSGFLQGNSLNNGKQPVANISWDDAAIYCNWLSQQDSLTPFYKISSNKVSGIDSAADGYRLPTEAEWAWAARTMSKDKLLKFPWGNKMPPGKNSGNYADSSAASFLGKTIANYNDGFSVAAPISSFDPNQKGLYDMGGNIAEWVHDYYSVKASSNKTYIDPLGPTRGEFHVVRGASWTHGTITELRLSFRDYNEKPREDVGFRIARYLE
ncbi:MAG: hypothetical protein CMF45_00765 [Legionellales bacterium]|nr:hypothetical protein [Legionellales bacterium]|tara:strand:+ start:1041 stop:3080 length:2040 start_codon:yes stop_codon:yes gene_type:complete